MNKITTAIVMLVAVPTMTACGNSANTSTPAVETINLTGTWTQVNAENNNPMTAEITSDAIKVSANGDNIKLPYWNGTFDSSKAPKITSVKNAGTQLSGSTEKVFTYKSDVLSFDFTAMGVTKTIQLKKA